MVPPLPLGAAALEKGWRAVGPVRVHAAAAGALWAARQRGALAQPMCGLGSETVQPIAPGSVAGARVAAGMGEPLSPLVARALVSRIAPCCCLTMS